jgi:hypothetical protein
VHALEVSSVVDLDWSSVERGRVQMRETGACELPGFVRPGALASFVAAILGLDEIHPYADPLGALNLAVMGDGDELQWHFDQTDFVVSLALQDADEGGDFEVAPFIRTADDERYDDVARVLAGDRKPLTVLPMTPGTLLVFAGRHSMHRVSPIRGSTPRLVGLFGYDSQPGTMSSDLLKAVRYGRVA